MRRLIQTKSAAPVLGLLVALALALPMIALSWNIQTVESAGDVGFGNSLALDPATGHPRISYHDRTNGDLKYAAWDGAAWTIETVDSTGDVGWYSSLALDPTTGRPRISYYDDTNGNLKYAAWDGATWVIETVDSTGNVGRYISLALDPTTGYPRISYLDVTNYVPKYAAWDGAAWAIETVDSSGRLGQYTSLALDPATGYPRISYSTGRNPDLKYAAWDGASWAIETVDHGAGSATDDSVGNAGRFSSLVLDAITGYPRISYIDDLWNPDEDHLKYASWDGASWTIETVDIAGNVPSHLRYPLAFISLALDPVTGHPRISYTDTIIGALKYAAWDGTAWAIESVESAADVGFQSSLALNRCGGPHISYDDDTNYDLKYAAADDHDCTPDPDAYEPSDTPSAAADLSEWQHMDWICLDELRGQFPPRGDEDKCPGVFDDGDAPAAAVDFWYRQIKDLTIDSVTDADFYHIDLPDYTDAAQGGHPDIDPDPTVVEPLFECGTTPRLEFVPGGVDRIIYVRVSSHLLIEIVPEENSLGPMPVAAAGETLALYRDDGAGWFRDDAMGQPDSPTRVKRIYCPQEGIDLRELVFSFGERDEPRESLYTTGGYTINLGYQITAERIIPDTANVFPGLIGPLPCLSDSYWPRAGFSFFPRCGSGFGPRFDLWGVHPVELPNFLPCLADGPNCLELFSLMWPDTNTALNAEIVAPMFMQFGLLDTNLNVIAEAYPVQEQPMRASGQEQPVTFLLEAGELPAGRYYLQVAGAPGKYVMSFAPPLTYDSPTVLLLPAITR